MKLVSYSKTFTLFNYIYLKKKVNNEKLSLASVYFSADSNISEDNQGENIIHESSKF